MAETQIRFDDGAAYERMMGNWSQRAGSIFLDWLTAPTGLKWIDVGCGNGAFTELLVERCAPAEVQGIDPSEGQVAFARKRPAARIAKFSHGDARQFGWRVLDVGNIHDFAVENRGAVHIFARLARLIALAR
jgi:ubiquinone/menaquinone biosynthesis C-methylase UbiE